jgi:hypothetical protein
MLSIVFVGAAMMMSETTPAGASAEHSFLVLNDQSITFQGAVPVFAPVGHRWDAKEQRTIEIIDGTEFAVDKRFWKMVKDNEAERSAKAEVRVGGDGHLFYRDKAVDLGLGVGRLDSVLRWHGWIVAVGTAADKSLSTIKGPVWYLFWFGEKDLKGSYRQISTTGPLPLRIYSK